MPIYEYLCNACGAEKEHLQKISDAPIAVCPNCGSNDYIKRISAAGFQLKGSGWYVTDFKNNQVKPSNTSPTEKNVKNDTTVSAEAKQSAPATSSESSPGKTSSTTSSTVSEG
ncbi:hypothetical protein W03_21920 [Nitrosomonas sp. PY1]|uniref:FmdB family zinc ribbon protein n=1 Tax=Nitrosomonas sp. PY1 TaxID=1803906 RepID=UPI001FC7C666|nr:zinc ribbon domain-containing protein [Nitrosomonas sp. PY1]GKS70188.1 hypothetical protein W03_21920 [Nitrosomonas sp. PY1]